MLKTPNRLLALLAVGALLLGTAACSDDGDSSSGDGGSSSDGGSGGDTGDILRAVATDDIVPAYEAFVDDLTALGATFDELCAAPGPDTLEASQEAWRTVATSWQSTRAGSVGPSMDRRLTSDVAFKARPDPVEDLIASDDPIDTESLRDKGSTFRGISLMEYLLFDDSASELVSAAGARRCAFLVNVTPVSVDAVQAVVDDWTTADPSYTDTFAEGEEGDPLMSVDALANQVLACLTAIDDNGIRDLAMAETLDDALSTRRDAAGGYVMAEHKALLDAVSVLVDGGFGDLVEARSPDTAERLRQLSEDAVAAFAVLPDSADASYTDHRPELQAAVEAIGALKVLVTTEVATQLGITIRFSDADGDS